MTILMFRIAYGGLLSNIFVNSIAQIILSARHFLLRQDRKTMERYYTNVDFKKVIVTK